MALYDDVPLSDLDRKAREVFGDQVVAKSLAQQAATQAAAPKGEDPATLTMAFVPSRDVSVIQLSADKIANYLSKEIGKPGEFEGMDDTALRRYGAEETEALGLGAVETVN